MTDYIKLLEKFAYQLNNIIKEQPGITEIPTPEYGWENYRYSGPKFRQAHVELFNQDRFVVIHCAIFPLVNDPAPIYGVDIIASNNKVTGVFMDLSPVTKEPESFHNLKFEKQRDRPEWGDIFSQNWIACRPNKTELISIIAESQRLLRYYLDDILLQDFGNELEIRAGQNRYCTQQQQNEHTLRALKNLIGPDRAKEFMQTVLFPTV